MPVFPVYYRVRDVKGHSLVHYWNTFRSSISDALEVALFVAPYWQQVIETQIEAISVLDVEAEWTPVVPPNGVLQDRLILTYRSEADPTTGRSYVIRLALSAPYREVVEELVYGRGISERYTTFKLYCEPYIFSRNGLPIKRLTKATFSTKARVATV